MMRKILSILLLFPLFVRAGTDMTETVSVNGINYLIAYWDGHPDITPWFATVVRGNYSGDIVIPSQIETSVIVGGSETYTFTVKRIAADAFKNCTGLISVSIPSSVDGIGTSINDDWGIFTTNPFIGCTNLSSIIVDEGNTKFDSRDNCNAIIEGKKLITGCKNTIIPASIESIYEYAFSGCSLESIQIPDGVATIYFGAFENCDNLKEIVLPSSLASIYSGAFTGCKSIKDVLCYAKNVPGVVYDGANTNIVFDESIKNATLHVRDFLIEFYKSREPWKEFKNIVVIEKVTEFNLIYYVDGKEYKTEKYKYDDEIIPLEYPTKEGYTFSGWSGILANMPGKDVKVYGTFTRNEVKANSVIYWALNEKAVVLGNDNASGGVSIEGKVMFNEKELPVTEIMDNSFNGCKGITTIDMPVTITNIGERAFAGIDKLTDVTIMAEEVPATDRTAFENSYIEDYVTLHVPGRGIKKYKETAPWKNFKEIVAIAGTEVTQTYKLIYMVDGEIYKTVDVKEGETITPEEIPTKEGYTFSGWGDVPDVMPSRDVIVSGAFTINKYKLTYIIDGIEYKTVEVEYGSEITPESEPTKEGYDFSGWSWIPSKMPAEDVTVTGRFIKASYEVDGATYQLDDYGAILISMDDAAGDVVINTEVTIREKKYKIFVIGEGAFQGNDRITSLTVPDGIEVIMPNAFDGCRNLIKMMLGKTVRQIGSKAFAGVGNAAAYTRADAEPLTIECYAESVPQADYDCFDGVDVASAILRVNDDLTGVYKTTSPWNQFGTILGFNETVAVIPIFADEEGAAIFSIDGRRIDKPQKGMNIIRSSKSAKKVFVR